MPAVPKPDFKRRVPKRAARGQFSLHTRLAIIERDNGLCVRCGRFYDEIHHVLFRSRGGLGTIDNGVCVCRSCHQEAHTKREVRQWFEQYRDKYLKMEESK